MPHSAELLSDGSVFICLLIGAFALCVCAYCLEFLGKRCRKAKMSAQTVFPAGHPAAEAASASHALLVGLWLQRGPRLGV